MLSWPLNSVLNHILFIEFILEWIASKQIRGNTLLLILKLSTMWNYNMSESELRNHTIKFQIVLKNSNIVLLTKNLCYFCCFIAICMQNSVHYAIDYYIHHIIISSIQLCFLSHMLWCCIQVLRDSVNFGRLLFFILFLLSFYTLFIEFSFPLLIVL